MSGVRLQVTVQGGRLELDKKLLRATMRAAGTEVASAARKLIRGTGGGAKLRGGRRKASAPGQPPASQTGALASSIKVRVFKSGEGVAIRDVARSGPNHDGAPYALFLEKGAKRGGGNTRDKANILLAGEVGRRGRILRSKNRLKAGAISQTRVLQPRPFLSVALASREASIAERVADSINQGIKFTRQKP